MSVRFIPSGEVAGPMMVRALGVDDLPDVIMVQRSVYPVALIESLASFARKLEVWPAGALGAFAGPEMLGYAFCHPWTDGSVVPLDFEGLVLPDAPDCLYIHDLAVRPERRGAGVASLLLDEIFHLACTHGFRHCSLVAVLEARAYWERQGFSVASELTYGHGESAWYMRRDVA